jgi:O-antigen/teichoic acid export membrane protein
MNQLQKIAKNIFFLFIGGIVSSLLSVILSIFIARFLGDVIFGGYSFVIAFVVLFSVFLDLGYETLLIRDVAKDKLKASNYLNNIISFRVVISFVLFITIFLLINILNYPENIKILIYLFGISQIIVSLSNIFRVMFRAFERMDYEAGVNIFTNIIRCSVGLLLLSLGYGIMEIALVFLFTAFIDFLISFLICEKIFVRIKPQFDLSFFKKTLKSALPLGSIAIFSLIYVRIDTVMLEFMKGDAVVGWYNASYNLILGFSPIPLLFLNALLPFMANTSEKSIESLKEVYKKAFKFLFVFGLPITIGILLLADKFIILFYGQDFLNSIVALKILSFDILLKFLYFCVFFVLIAVDKQNKMAVIAGCGVLINIVLNLFLIPEYSLVGASIATIITETFILVMYLYYASVNNLKIPLSKIFFKPVIACGVMAIFIYYFNDLNLFLVIFFSVLIYFFILFLLRDFSKEDKYLIKKLIKRQI